MNKEGDAPTLSDCLTRTRAELEGQTVSAVDLVEKAGLRNPYRRHAILTSREVIYES